jgi:hypothetical protein
MLLYDYDNNGCVEVPANMAETLPWDPADAV